MNKSIYTASTKELRDAATKLAAWPEAMRKHGYNSATVTKGQLMEFLADQGLKEIEVAEVPAPGHAPAAPMAAAAVAPVAAAEGLDEEERRLIEILRNNRKPAVDVDTVRAIITEELAKQEPREIKVKINDREPVLLEERTHPLFSKVLKLAMEGVNVLLVGPAGCGKTHLFSQVAKAAGKRRASISMTEGTTESDLFGKLLPAGENGAFQYFASDLVEMITADDGAFLIDEMDNSNANTLGMLNQLTSQGYANIVARKVSGLPSLIERAPGSILMATANTFGTGAGALYVGRNQLDAATLDRYYVIQMDYDRTYENGLAPSHVVDWVWKVRECITANRWRRVASTRMIQKAAAGLRCGLDWKDVKADLVSGWTRDEIAKLPA